MVQIGFLAFWLFVAGSSQPFLYLYSNRGWLIFLFFSFFFKVALVLMWAYWTLELIKETLVTRRREIVFVFFATIFWQIRIQVLYFSKPVWEFITSAVVWVLIPFFKWIFSVTVWRQKPGCVRQCNPSMWVNIHQKNS